MDRKALNRLLFNAAKFATHEAWRHDNDRIKEVRDMACIECYGTDYKKLSDSEIEHVINELNEKSGGVDGRYVKPAKASFQQVKLLRYYAIVCAIRYCNLDGLECKEYSEPIEQQSVTMQDGTTVEIAGNRKKAIKVYDYHGEMLRDWLKNQFERKGGRVPMSAFKHLHNEWINPKSHQFLIEAKFKTHTTNPKRFHYDKLTPREAQKLIDRFREIADNVNMKVTVEDFETMANMN